MLNYIKIGECILAKAKNLYVCSNCGAQSLKWMGQCLECNVWNSLHEERVAENLSPNTMRYSGYAGAADNSKVISLNEIQAIDNKRISTGIMEFDRVLGNGLVAGSVILLGGDPGIGKSTLLLQTLIGLSLDFPTLYVTGEESPQQIALRAQRLNLLENKVQLLAETRVSRIIEICAQTKPCMVVIDSIQTLYCDELTSAPGSVSQVRESAAQLVHYAKRTNTILFLIGHVTKEGALAGPRILEHMVDTVLYFEGQADSRFRMIRAFKNRYGAANELGVFAMTEQGLREVANPSAIFLSGYQQAVSGSVIMATWEGTRPLLVEVQALVNESSLAQPRRVTVGFEQNRLAMLLAVLQRHAGTIIVNQDVFINIVGGLRVVETAVDLALLLAIISSLRNQAVKSDLVAFGEVGLAGEIRPVQGGQERLKEALKHGFKRVIMPFANKPKSVATGIEVYSLQHIGELLEILPKIMQ